MVFWGQTEPPGHKPGDEALPAAPQTLPCEPPEWGWGWPNASRVRAASWGAWPVLEERHEAGSSSSRDSPVILVARNIPMGPGAAGGRQSPLPSLPASSILLREAAQPRWAQPPPGTQLDRGGISTSPWRPRPLPSARPLCVSRVPVTTRHFIFIFFYFLPFFFFFFFSVVLFVLCVPVRLPSHVLLKDHRAGQQSRQGRLPDLAAGRV